MKILEIKKLRYAPLATVGIDKINEIIETVNQLVKKHNELDPNEQARLLNELNIKEMEERN